jgi:dihydroxy-acid dehydratase
MWIDTCSTTVIPLTANLQPHGPLSMVALHQLGGLPVVTRELIDHG